MRHEKPLMFISSPVIRKYRYTHVLEEESTSIFELEHSRGAERTELPAVPESPAIPEPEEALHNPEIKNKLEYLHHPLRKELYQPLEMITESGSVKGKLHNLENETVWVQSDGNLTSVPIKDILDIRWKQQSFSIY
ncbi:hypothetical protein SporoP37_13545 [Sporosarcina sp. P37]|uniref:hypothetical protein n=1 Tax=unclassified Sporosarcina TaxID=2647733 RepID=UPI000A17DA41|nr:MULTISPECIES: hypothetical protein [unclassified Sporosarcina]ARK25576.1 hypothetical protein SporoP37_13545 [Sporosarcina sp. P37]PID17291.1 hypothetical protein CSV62_14190 [Sporosarcina sp. P35]